MFTIHNIQYQGRYGREILEYVLGIDDAHFRSGFMAMDGDVNLMKAAIVASTAVTTVSPTYAAEIQTEYYGYRLDSVLRMNSYKLHGILNGIDMDAFNPETDPKLFKNYGPRNPEDKTVNKLELLKLCGLEGDENTPVIGMVTRFVDQKGLDLIEAVLHDILSDDLRLIVLGKGDWRYEQMFLEAKRRYPAKISASIMFSGDLANRIYGGCDMFLMPSKFEPCGLAQMISLRYGTIDVYKRQLQAGRHDLRIRGKAQESEVHAGVHVHLYLLLEKAAPVSDRGRGEQEVLQRLRQGYHSDHAGQRGEDGLLSVRGLLEGRRHDRIPVGSQHGPALAEFRTQPQGR